MNCDSLVVREWLGHQAGSIAETLLKARPARAAAIIARNTGEVLVLQFNLHTQAYDFPDNATGVPGAFVVLNDQGGLIRFGHMHE